MRQSPVSVETQPQPQPSRPRPNWTAGRVIGMIVSSIAALVGGLMLLGGLALIAVHGLARDDDGYYTTDTERLRKAISDMDTARRELERALMLLEQGNSLLSGSPETASTRT